MTTLTTDQLAQGWLFHERFGYSYDKIPPGLAFEAYGKALLMCASGDGRVADDERDWVVGYFAAFDSPAEVTNALQKFDDAKNFADPSDNSAADTVAMGDTVANKGRRWLIWDALNACAADGALKDGELKRVRAMGNQVGLSEDVVSQIEKLHREETELKKKKFDVLWPEGIPAEYL